MDDTAPLPTPLLERLAHVRSVGVITGAGISQESGIQTYRGEGGVYDDPDEGDRLIESLSGATLLRDPDRTWRAVAGLARQAMDARPNPGHRAIAEIEQRVGRFVLLTQNVDGLHRDAGSQNIIEIHGTVFRTLCMQCQDRRPVDRDFYQDLDHAPGCDRCGGTLRPDVVLFDEMLPMGEVARIESELNRTPPDLVVSVGTSALFAYIVEPVLRANAAGRLTIEVNPQPTDLSGDFDYSLRAKGGELMPAIAAAIPAVV